MYVARLYTWENATIPMREVWPYLSRLWQVLSILLHVELLFQWVCNWMTDGQPDCFACTYVQGLLDTRVILLNRNITVRPNLIWRGNRRRASSLLWACCMPVFGKGTGSLKQLWLMVHMAGMLLRCFPVTSTDRTIYQNWPIEALHVEFYLQERFPPCTCSQWTLPAHRKTCYSGSQTTNPVSHINHKIKTKAVW